VPDGRPEESSRPVQLLVRVFDACFKERRTPGDKVNFCTTSPWPAVTIVLTMYLAAGSSSRAGSAEPDPLTVLVVDDERSIVEALSDLLESEGYRVASATDGTEALEQLLGGLRPCLIVLDLMMPRMDGWDFRHAQMTCEELKDIPVVILTAAGFSEASVKAQFGDVEFVSKPFAPQTLLRVVQQRCGEVS
jgi:CheY-like chemotaxis protein